MQPVDNTSDFLSTLFNGKNKESLFILIKKRAKPINYFGPYHRRRTQSKISGNRISTSSTENLSADWQKKGEKYGKRNRYRGPHNSLIRIRGSDYV
jgi:hypothetical protein